MFSSTLAAKLPKQLCGNGTAAALIVEARNLVNLSIADFSQLNVHIVRLKTTNTASLIMRNNALANTSITHLVINGTVQIENDAFNGLNVGKVLTIALSSNNSGSSSTIAEHAFRGIYFSSEYNNTQLRIHCENQLINQSDPLPDLSDLALKIRRLVLLECEPLLKELHYDGENSTINLEVLFGKQTLSSDIDAQPFFAIDSSLVPSQLNLNSLIIRTTVINNLDLNISSTYQPIVCITARTLNTRMLAYFGTMCNRSLLAFAKNLEVLHIVEANYSRGKHVYKFD